MDTLTIVARRLGIWSSTFMDEAGLAVLDETGDPLTDEISSSLTGLSIKDKSYEEINA